MHTDIELLAPARNKEIGTAAINCGADAVYIAGPSFGARVNAGNDIEDIAGLCRHAHKFGARVYVTVNTILYENELQEAFAMMEQCAEAGCDAFIIQDLAITEHFAGRKDFPPFFASTQCAIRTPVQAAWLESLGFKRLILERELTLGQIREIRRAVTVDLEFFVHGALCVCYSGNCYLSEYLAGRSANRGECIQACRSRYDLADSKGKILVKDKALLSLKDLSLIDRLDDLIDAGISSFKIEGRLKNASYVKNTVSAYSRALDKITGRRDGLHRQSFGKTLGGFTPDLHKTFNRGYTELALDNVAPGWSSMDNATAIGEKIGKIAAVDKTGSSMRLLISGKKPLHNGDGLCFIGSDGVTGFRADVCDGNTITAKYVPGLVNGMDIYRNTDTAFEKELENNAPKRYLEVSGHITITENDGEYLIEAAAECENGVKAEFSTSCNQERAENESRMKESIAAQFGKKTGFFDFSLASLNVNGRLPYLPASFINMLRRELARQLESLEIPPVRESVPVPGNTGNTPDFSDYKANCSNSLSRKIYESIGKVSPEKAYEISHGKNKELMRSRYCIKRELGMCPKFGGKLPSGVTEPLYLINNGRSLRLEFDCTRCEMIVKDL